MNKRERDRKTGRVVSAQEWAKQSAKGYEPTSIKLPEGIEFFRLDRVGKFRLDFLNYRVGEGNPRASKGEEHFEREYASHGFTTPNGYRSYVCNAAAFNTRCAPCDWLRKNGGTADQEFVRSLRGKIRHLWLVNDDPDNAKSPIFKVFDTGHYNRGVGFGELMADAIADLDEDATPFALQNGYTATLVVKEMSRGKGQTYKAVTRISFSPRKKDYSPKLLDEMPCLDNLLVAHDYKAVMQLLESGMENGDDDDEDDDVGAPKKQSYTTKVVNTQPQEDDDDEDEDDEDDDVGAPKKQSYTTKVVNTRPQEDDDDEDEDDEDDDDVGAPKKQTRTVRAPTNARPQKDDDDEDDDEDEDDEDEDDEDEDDEDDEDELKKQPVKSPINGSPQDTPKKRTRR